MSEVTELYSLLIPLADGRLIVPRSCVAEVVGFASLETLSDSPPWLTGAILWHDTRVPVISFEGTCGQDIPEIAKRSRIAVFNGLGEQMSGRHFGVVAQGFPQMVRVNAEVLSLNEKAQIPDSYPVLCQLRMMNERPYIPDLEKLEALIAEHYALQPA